MHSDTGSKMPQMWPSMLTRARLALPVGISTMIDAVHGSLDMFRCAGVSFDATNSLFVSMVQDQVGTSTHGTEIAS